MVSSRLENTTHTIRKSRSDSTVFSFELFRRRSASVVATGSNSLHVLSSLLLRNNRCRASRPDTTRDGIDFLHPSGVREMNNAVSFEINHCFFYYTHFRNDRAMLLAQ